MELSRRKMLQVAVATGAMGVVGADASGAVSGSSSGPLTIDPRAWRYDAANDVFWQLGCSYAARPAAPQIQTLGIYVPGAFLTATPNGDGTYTAAVNPTGTLGGFTAATAPIVLPVNTPGYSSQRPPAVYEFADAAWYVKSGFVYVAAGMRGQDTQTTTYTGNAPWGVTDLKAAVRYLRLNNRFLPGSTDRIYVFGMSGGGAQSSIIGASGDSRLYTPYLAALGAAQTSDAVAGVMAWCPVTSLDWANASYEWNMGQFASTGTRAPATWTSAYSGNLAAAFGPYINRLRLKDAAGRRLNLHRSHTGHYLRGSYYDHVLSVITRSLNNYLSDATPGPGYVAALNGRSPWIHYNQSSNRAQVMSLEGFVRSQKNCSKDVGAFDGIACGAVENRVHGIGTETLHFSPVSRQVLRIYEHHYSTLPGWTPTYGYTAYRSDFTRVDSEHNDVLTRLAMYNPMYYLARAYNGFHTSCVAPHWRIRTGITQGDTANTTEINLALALAQRGVRNVDFETVWGQGHVPAERTGNPVLNFIAWVRQTA